MAPTCFTKLQGFLDFRCFLIASPRNYVVTLTLTGRSCKMSCQYSRINQSQVYCFIIKLMNTSSHEYKNSTNVHTSQKRGRIRRLFQLSRTAKSFGGHSSPSIFFIIVVLKVSNWEAFYISKLFLDL